MKCPIHIRTTLEPYSVEPGVQVQRCPRCEGAWMSMADYWAWRETLTAPLTDVEPTDMGRDAPPLDSDAGKRCPCDGGFLIRHAVGHGVRFNLDRCGHCGGVWFDAKEWDTLVARNLHDDLHLVFTSSWQAEVRKQRRNEADAKMLIDRLGKADAKQAGQIRQWVLDSGNDYLIAEIVCGVFDAALEALLDG